MRSRLNTILCFLRTSVDTSLSGCQTNLSMVEMQERETETRTLSDEHDAYFTHVAPLKIPHDAELTSSPLTSQDDFKEK